MAGKIGSMTKKKIGSGKKIGTNGNIPWDKES